MEMYLNNNNQDFCFINQWDCLPVSLSFQSKDSVFAVKIIFLYQNFLSSDLFLFHSDKTFPVSRIHSSFKSNRRDGLSKKKEETDKKSAEEKAKAADNKFSVENLNSFLVFVFDYSLLLR
jgi:hypothetical protein